MQPQSQIKAAIFIGQQGGVITYFALQCTLWLIIIYEMYKLRAYWDKNKLHIWCIFNILYMDTQERKDTECIYNTILQLWGKGAGVALRGNHAFVLNNQI